MKLERLSAWFPIALLGAVAVLTLWLDHQVQTGSSGRDGKTRHEPDYFVDNLNATRYGPLGTPVYTLHAEHMTHYPDDDSTELTLPRFVHFSRSAAPVVAVSRTALVSSNGEDVYMRDDVRLVRQAYANKSELVLETSYLHLIPDDNLAETSRPVKIYNANTLVTGIGLKFNNETQVLDLLANVQSTYQKPAPAAR